MKTVLRDIVEWISILVLYLLLVGCVAAIRGIMQKLPVSSSRMEERETAEHTEVATKRIFLSSFYCPQKSNRLKRGKESARERARLFAKLGCACSWYIFLRF